MIIIRYIEITKIQNQEVQKMFDIFNKKKLKAYRLITDIQSILINRVIKELEKQLKKREKNIARQAEVTRKNVKKRAELNNKILALQIDLEEANKKVSALSDENRKLKEELKKFDEEHYCVTFCKRNNAVDEVSNVAKCSD
jgi:chromosome segregation ATPase